MDSEQHIHDRLFARNVTGTVAVEFFWGLGLPVVIDSTFLQLLLKRLGASNLVVGFLPMFFALGVAVFSLAAGMMAPRIGNCRRLMVTSHLALSAPLLIYGWYLWFADFTGSALPVFLAAYALFCAVMGFTMPFWHDYLLRIFGEHRAVQGIGIMYAGQYVARLAGGATLAWHVEHTNFSAPGVSILFIALGSIFFASSFFFLMTRELPQGEAPPPPTAPPGVIRSVITALGNRRFRSFILYDAGFYGAVGIVSFYADFAVHHRGVEPSIVAGWFVAAAFLGGIVTHLLFGWRRIAGYRTMFIGARLMPALALALILGPGTLTAFLSAAFLFGAAGALRALTYAPVIKHLSGGDATAYLSVAPCIMLPVSLGLPAANGALLDLLAGAGDLGYRIGFMAMGIIIVGSLAWVRGIGFPGDAEKNH